MDYQACYDRLMERARGRVLEGYRERHHVVPKCVRPNNDTVDLTPEEHYLAHQLLVKIYPGNGSLVFAATRMTRSGYRVCRVCNKLYGWLRRRHAQTVADLHRGREVSPETRAKMRSAKLGKRRDPHTHETKAKMREAALGKPKSEAHKVSLSQAARGQVGHNTGRRWTPEMKLRAAITFGRMPIEEMAKVSLAKLSRNNRELVKQYRQVTLS